MKSRCTEGIIERGLALSNGRDVGANLVGLPEGFGLGEEPTVWRPLKSLKPFTLKPPSLGLFAPFLRSKSPPSA